MSLKSIQDKAVDNFSNKHRGEAFDPAVIFSFGELIADFIARLQECRTASEAGAMVKSPSRWQKRVLAVRVRKELGGREFRKNGKDVIASLLETGKSTSVAEIQEAYDEV